jgi:hypothetical protein
MMKHIEAYNQLCAERWLETGGMDTLERYVISETLVPNLFQSYEIRRGG